MLMLIAGLLVFLAPHSLALFAPAWKQEKSSSLGSLFKGIYSVVSLLGLVMIVYGYAATRAEPVFIWNPPAAMAHIASLLMLFAMILLVSTYVPGNKIRAMVGHPMTLAVKVWAIAHLLANGRLGDIVLFLSLLIWAVLLFINRRRKDRAASVSGEGVSVESLQNTLIPTIITVVIGLVVWAVFAMWLHLRLIGVSPFGA